MNRIGYICFLLCMYLSVAVHAQEKTYCIPVRTVDEEELAYAAGEKMSFTMHYEWGVINSDTLVSGSILETL